MSKHEKDGDTTLFIAGHLYFQNVIIVRGKNPAETPLIDNNQNSFRYFRQSRSDCKRQFRGKQIVLPISQLQVRNTEKH